MSEANVGRGKPHPEGFPLRVGLDWLLDRFREFGKHHAIGCKGKLYSYNDLRRQVDNYIKELSTNINKGEVVAILSDYSFHSIALFIALAVNKNIIVPVVTRVDDEVKGRLKEAFVDKTIRLQARGMEIESVDGNAEKHPLIARLQNAGSSGLVLFSSGSTGRPKAILHDLEVLIESFKAKRIKKSLRMLVFLMFDHIGGVNTLFTALSRGAAMFILESRDPDHICSIIEKEKITVLPVSPTFLNLILIGEAHKRYDLGSLKTVTYGAEIMPESLLKKLEDEFKNVKFSQMFGTSETGIAHTVGKSPGSTYMKIDDPNQECRIVDGELWIRSKTQALGYLNAGMENFSDDGWFKTGDLVESAENGHIRIIGRKNDVINVGGEKVLPGEVEAALLEMDEIMDCMVYSEPNAITGQSVAVEVVLKKEVEPKSVKKLIRKYCREKLDGYKIPARVKVVERTSYGDRFKKIRKGL